MRFRSYPGVVALMVLLSCSSAFAQDATVAGTIVDESSAVLPGVTVSATEIATGRQFTGVTSERGEYRLPGMPAGRYRMQAELPGFATVLIQEVEILVGQNATVPFTMKVAALAENLTVTAEAPLIDTVRAQVSGNVDRRQMEALPIQGRNWLELSMMVKGVTANSVAERPGVTRDSQFQLNLDGQQITQNLCCSATFGQPGMSREAIAEYQIVTNMFDVTMGRSSGLQVQAISRSGTNDLHGSVYGFFRDDRFNSEDFVAQRVLPYANQQTGFALGGPIARDRAQFFVSYEYEREPNTIVMAPPALGGQSLSLATKTRTHNFLTRYDQQFGSNNHLTVRGIYWDRFNPVDQITGSSHPTQGAARGRDATIISGSWSRVLSSTLVQEVRFGYYDYHWLFAPMDGVPATPEYRFPGLTIGGRWNYPEEMSATIKPSLRYDLTWHKGKHDFKIGGEYIRGRDFGDWPARSRGQFNFSSIPADVARRFPIDAWNDASRWDLNGLAPSSFVQASLAPGGDWLFVVPRPTYAVWVGDNWTVSDRLTLNLGVRYDLAYGDTAPPGVTESDILIDNGLFTENVGFRNTIRDVNNVAPRVGFSLKANRTGDLIIRGGTGMFFGNSSSTQAIEQVQFSGAKVLTDTYVNTGRADFITNPTGGAAPGRSPQSPAPIAHDFVQPFAWQSMLGFQKQLGAVFAVDADLVYWRGYDEDSQRDPNLFYDPVTGFNKDPRVFGRPNPAFGEIILRESQGRSDYMALASSLTRRFRNNFQAGLTYTLMFFKHDNGGGSSAYGGFVNNVFDIDDEWARSSDFQRHTLRANAIYRLPWDVSVAGSLFVGSGNYFNPTSGVNPLGLGVNYSGIIRLRPDFTLLERNSFKGEPLQKIDMRVSKDVVLGGVRLSGIAEVFNIFNHANYGAYNTLSTSSTFGTPRQSLSTAYLPRVWQLAFKVSF